MSAPLLFWSLCTLCLSLSRESTVTSAPDTLHQQSSLSSVICPSFASFWALSFLFRLSRVVSAARSQAPVAPAGGTSTGDDIFPACAYIAQIYARQTGEVK